MLKTRVIPTLLWKDVGLVKGVGFNSWRRIGALLPAVKVYNFRQVDELMVLNINATQNRTGPDYDIVSEIANECFVPLTIGGGISEIDHITRLLRLGADKIAINSAAYKNPSLLKETAFRFGSQCLVASIDIKKVDNEYYCFSNSGAVPTPYKVIEWAQQVEELGAGEILLTDIDLDGTFKGYNIDIIRKVSDAVSIPVIASGGAGAFHHFSDAILNANADAVAAASIFHFTEITPLEVKEHLKKQGIKTRK